MCLEELGRKLAEPLSPTADAEELSEQLDLVERLMEREAGQGERMTAIADSLLQQVFYRNPMGHYN